MFDLCEHRNAENQLDSANIVELSTGPKLLARSIDKH